MNVIFDKFVHPAIVDIATSRIEKMGMGNPITLNRLRRIESILQFSSMGILDYYSIYLLEILIITFVRDLFTSPPVKRITELNRNLLVNGNGVVEDRIKDSLPRLFHRLFRA